MYLSHAIKHHQKITDVDAKLNTWWIKSLHVNGYIYMWCNVLMWNFGRHTISYYFEYYVLYHIKYSWNMANLALIHSIYVVLEWANKLVKKRKEYLVVGCVFSEILKISLTVGYQSIAWLFLHNLIAFIQAWHTASLNRRAFGNPNPKLQISAATHSP